MSSDNLLACATFVLAFATVLLAIVSHINAKKQAKATAEGQVMPKIVHNMKSKEWRSSSLVSFYFNENRPFFPVIRIRKQGEKQWKEYRAEDYSEVEVTPVKTNIEPLNIVWQSSAPREKVEEYLSRYKECPSPLILEVEIEFHSYSGELYKYAYKLDINADGMKENQYYVKKTLLKKVELPWKEGLWSSLKHIFSP